MTLILLQILDLAVFFYSVRNALAYFAGASRQKKKKKKEFDNIDYCMTPSAQNPRPHN
jgi:hypothetical protein